VTGDIGSGLVNALPQVMPLSPPIGDPLRDVTSLLSRELAASEPGQTTVLDRLLDILLVLSIRTCFRQSATTPRWCRAAADPRLKTALQLIHEQPGRSWSVPELARISGLSRAAFARAFGDALGQPPMQYLTDWRMTLARDYLRTSDIDLAGIAERIGYGSPYAFASAFKRHHGCPPGAWRQHALDIGETDRSIGAHLG
jgi:AraC-like DNA-binding protein